MIKKVIIALIFTFSSFAAIFANEGMWIPLLLEKYNIEEMQKMGFKLTAEDIYSVNRACLKDAVVIFAGGCTGEVISDNGLVITNHHCGYDYIQAHSSVDHDYLTNGFWAMNQEEELPNDDISVVFLKRMEDVTFQVLAGTDSASSDIICKEIIQKNIEEITSKATENTHYKAIVKPFFNENQYFLFVNEEFTDVRLVGTPPSAIGKFGGDTDNWMWPRHTGDFSLFRIYAGKDNKPADYSKENVPYKPLKHLNISTKGIKEGDFTMVLGYPGSTVEYAPSFYLKMITEKINPELINLRGNKLSIINKFKESDPAIRIQYAAKHASISNSWKKWIGEIKGLEKLNAIEKKEQQESDFQRWAEKNNPEINNSLIAKYKDLYQQYGDYKLAYNFFVELIYRNGIEIAEVSSYFMSLESEAKKAEDLSALKIEKENTLKELELFYKDYHAPLDKEMTKMLIKVYQQKIPGKFHPDIFKVIQKKYNGNVDTYVDDMFKRSLFTQKEKAINFLNNFSAKSIKKLNRDMAYQLFKSFRANYYDNIFDEYNSLKDKINDLDKKYMTALMEYNTGKVFYPDANFTMRVSYGNVESYLPRDAVKYKYYTTLDGIIEKDNPEIYDYRVPEKLKQLYRDKDFGLYESEGTVPVCFIATNHTTGGNSGSPVLNANGELIGVNFDRAWEGVMSDMMFNPEQCRNITLDIRYALFIIDKYAGAGYLLDEMTIVK